MTGREKVRRALAHKEGPVPFDLGGYPTTGIHCLTLEQLREYYGLEKRPVTIVDPYQMLGLVERDLQEAMGIDTQPFWAPGNLFGFANADYREWRAPWGQTVLVPRDFRTTEGEAGTYIYACGDMEYAPAAVMPKTGYFFDAINRQQGEIDDDALDVEQNLEEFSAVSDEDLAQYRRRAAALDPERAALGNFGGTALGDIALVTGPMLRVPKGIRDVTEWYISTVTRQDHVRAVFEKQTQLALENLQKVWDAVGDKVDTIYICGTDFGTQRAPFCSVDTFRSLYKPYYTIINDWVHTHTSWRTFKHSCGSVFALIPEMIDCGFDILNPVQWTADGMDRRKLKEEFGRDIVFWGGGVDTQHTLPHGTPEEVRRQVLETCEIFAKDGGFVFNTIHNIQAKVPVENIAAMVGALREFNR